MIAYRLSVARSLGYTDGSRYRNAEKLVRVILFQLCDDLICQSEPPVIHCKKYSGDLKSGIIGGFYAFYRVQEL